MSTVVINIDHHVRGRENSSNGRDEEENSLLTEGMRACIIWKSGHSLVDVSEMIVS